MHLSDIFDLHLLSASRSDSHSVHAHVDEENSSRKLWTKKCSRKHVDEENSYDLIGVRQHQPARRVSRRTVPLRLIGFSVVQFRLASFISASGSAARAPHTTLISASGDSVLRRFG